MALWLPLLSLQGRRWVRRAGDLPLRVWVWAALKTVCDEATVDVMSSHGFVAPLSVRHVHIVDGRVTRENLYLDKPFRLFNADADIRFAPDDEPLPEPPSKNPQ